MENFYNCTSNWLLDATIDGAESTNPDETDNGELTPNDSAKDVVTTTFFMRELIDEIGVIVRTLITVGSVGDFQVANGTQ